MGDFLPEKMRFGALADACLLVGPPVLYLLVFLAPSETRLALSLSHTAPTFYSLYTSHFVHFTEAHLTANVVGYLIAATVGYLLAHIAGTRGRYRIALFVIVTVLPPVLSLLNLAIPRQSIGYGASGVVMGVVGLVPVFVFVYLHHRPQTGGSVEDAPVLFFCGFAVVGVSAPIGWLGAGVSAAALLSAVLYGIDIRIDFGSVRRLPPGHLELLAAGVIIGVGYPAVAFPSNLHVQGGIVNLYVHLLGYALGFIPAYLTPSIGSEILFATSKA
ncbi:rhomboid family intramembrane serine protease [Halorubrum sp. GN11_10-6_MGM]|uniref:rhomboid family intramembrane serine protease n=1 Tax=Halorubrum sp. GN11_10-6_MGM TaxID=2518112 RepID=UPI0010FA59AA|nr:rhomboid family intramembrane serine protease [Halorubrum sp. GN11_10-6_MGM]TKX72914.1 rhomboid family intramembrane serine protease [Halorubrum sp. GN11_10-6_MGM]